MSLARSLTSRMRARFEDNSSGGAVPNRAFSIKTGAGAARNNDTNNIDRRLISLPVELLSTSNAQAYEAPDIKNLIEPKQHLQAPYSPAHSTFSQQPLSPHIPLHPQSPADQLSPQLTFASSASSTHSWDDGLTSPASPALTSASSVTSHEPSRESSPLSYDPNPMSKSFLFEDSSSTKDKALQIRVTEIVPASPVDDEVKMANAFIASPTAPAIPQRSATHTKEIHQTLARQRSLSRVSASPRQSATAEDTVELLKPASPTKLHAPQLSPGILRTGTDLFPTSLDGSTPSKGEEHPFGAELAKVSELVQEIGAGAVQIVDEETQFLVDNGFRCFGATDYILEIQPLFSRAFGEPALPVISEWI